MSNSRDIKLAWVLVGGKIRSVEEFVDTPRPDLPTAFCPECDDSVTLRLGKQRVPHAAHKPGTICLGTAPETILHVNTKFYIASQLRLASTLSIRIECPGLPIQKCYSSTPVHNWISDWDSVHAEHRLGNRRPDIVLSRNQDPIAAIEVFVSNQVSQAKSEDLHRLGLPWIEVSASSLSITGNDRWTHDSPLRVHRASDPSTVLCSECQRLLDLRHSLYGTEDPFPELSRKRSHQPPVSRQTPPSIRPSGRHRIVHYYYPSGKRFSEVITYNQKFSSTPSNITDFKSAYLEFFRIKLQSTAFIDFRTDGWIDELPPKLGVFFPYRFYWDKHRSRWKMRRDEWEIERMNYGSNPGELRRGRKWSKAIIGFNFTTLPLSKKSDSG